MKKYELVEHTADVRLKLQADNLEELFEAALEGMAELIKQGACKEQQTQQISLDTRSLDSTTLLIDFLSDVLTQTHIHKVVYCKATFRKFNDTAISAQLIGVPVDSFDEDVKSVTYHEAEVKKNKDGLYETVVIFDI